MPSVTRVKLLLGGSVAALSLLTLAPAGASSANISHSFRADAAIADGSLVSLDPNKTNYVEPATVTNGDQLIGVAVNSNDSLIAVDPTAGDIQVATSGTSSVLVSDVDGAVGVGDQIAVSPFRGIGMKAGPGDRVIGLAQSAFSSTSVGASEQTITDNSGAKHKLYIGEIRLNIGVGTAPNSATGQNSLQRFSKSLTGHTVSTVRVVVSLMILIVSVIALITLIYSSIYGSITSIGRNPLAKYAIFRTLSSVLLMSLAMAMVAAATIFLMLR